MIQNFNFLHVIVLVANQLYLRPGTTIKLIHNIFVERTIANRQLPIANLQSTLSNRTKSFGTRV